jgi:uncharacterized membrane protein YdjX (TVP38/TMEM64 family)
LQQYLLDLFREYPNLAFITSIFLSIIIAILGVVPSIFITAANILFFGFWNGTLISFLGEAIGAGVAFLLYRKGFKQASQKKLQQYPAIQKIISAENRQAFTLVFSLRLIPYVPSGLITFAAAIGKISFYIFLAASSLGKLPALFIEAASVYGATQSGWQGKLILAIFALILLYLVLQKKKLTK